MADEKLTKNQRRDQAREQARLAREEEKKREKRNRLFLQGGVALGVLAVLAVVALIITQSMKPAGPGPENMASGGVVLTQDLEIVPTPALEDGDPRVAPTVDRTEPPLDISVYVDYACVHCSQFEQTNGSVLEHWAGSGDATVQIYPVNILDSGSRYSTRAANLISCLADQSTDGSTLFNTHANLLSNEVWTRASEQGGLSDDELIEQAELGGVEVNDELRQCVKDVRFSGFVNKTTSAITQQTGTGVLGLAEGAQLQGRDGLQSADGPQFLQGTPLVIVNGQEWKSGVSDYSDFEEYLLKLKAELEGANGEDSGASTADESETE